MTARGNNRNGNRNRAPLGGCAVVESPGIVPMPSVLDGRRYQVRDSGGITHPAWVQRIGDERGTMVVPMGDDPASHRVRLHEMSHVRWSPANPSLPEGVSGPTMNAAEDRRMHRRLQETGFSATLDAPLFGPEDWQKLADQFGIHDDPENAAEPFPDLEVARMILASDGTAEGERFRTIACEYRGRSWIADLVDEVMDRHGIRARRPAWKTTLAVAKEIDDFFSGLDEMEPGLKRQLPDADQSTSGGEWGEMTVREMPLTDPLPRGMKERTRRATDTGAVPRNWHRLPLDGSVFTRKVKRPGGGTVLLDQSGSMGLDPSEVLDLMAAFPGVTIGTYAGTNSRGELRIIARNGRRASEEDCYHPWEKNVVDGPALDWLLDQPGPRVWISDGYVTGANVGMTRHLLMDAAEKVARGNVIMVDRMGALLPGGGGLPEDE